MGILLLCLVLMWWVQLPGTAELFTVGELERIIPLMLGSAALSHGFEYVSDWVIDLVQDWRDRKRSVD